MYTIGTFQNPLGAITTSTWKLEVTDSGGNVILEKTSGITHTTTTNIVSVNSASRPSASTTVGMTSDYDISFTPSSRMLSDSTIRIVFPYDQITYDGSTTCMSGATSIACTFTSIDATQFKIEATQWCNPGGEWAAGSTITLTLKNAINPGFVTSPLSSSLKIYTLNNQLTGTPTIDEVTTGTQFSPSLTPGALTAITAVKDASTNKVSEKTSYTISFTVVTAIGAGWQIKLTFPAETVYKAASTEVVCKDSNSNTKSCKSDADVNNNVKTVNITDACPSGCSTGTALQYTITEVYNPGSTGPISTSFEASTQTSSEYLIDTGSAITTKNFLSVVAGSCADIWGDGFVVIPTSGYWDDGNSVSGDGWSSDWKIEKRWKCTGGSATTPSTCSKLLVTLEKDYPEIETTLETTHVVIGTGISINIVASSFNVGSSNSVFALINQLQLVIILMIIKTPIPEAIREYVASYDFVILDFDFSPIPKLPLVDAPIQYMGYRDLYEIQEHWGLEYSSAFLNIYSSFIIFMIIIAIHILLLLIPELKEPEEGIHESKPRAFWRKLHKFLKELIRFKIYVSYIVETQILMLLASLTEISNFYIDERPYIASMIIAFAMYLFCIFLLWFQFYYAFLRNSTHGANIVCQEMFVELKEESWKRKFTALQQLRRVLLVTSIVFLGFINGVAVFWVIIIIQLSFMVSMFILRPFESKKDAIIESINEMFYISLIVFLFIFHFEDWTSKITEIFMIVLTINTLLISLVTLGKPTHL